MTITVDRMNGLSGSLAIKAPVRVATTANITLSGLQTIDGVTVVADDRVLVKDQTSGVDNGIYVASSSAWQRDKDFDGSYDVVQGTLVIVQSGTANNGVMFKITTEDPVVGTSSLTFLAANDISLSGNLAATSGATLVGSDDGQSGALWTTVAGAISDLHAGATTVAAGIVKSSGTALSVAVAGTDYLAPASIGTTVQAYDADIPTVAGTSAEVITGTETAVRSWAPDQLNASITGLFNDITLGTPVATTSGTAINFTGIPAGTKRVTVNFNGVSLNDTSPTMLQLGDSGGIETTGYLGSSIASSTPDAGFVIGGTLAATTRYGSLILSLVNSTTNTWACMGVMGRGDAASADYIGGVKSLSGALDRVRITTPAGTGTFDAGEINISYE